MSKMKSGLETWLKQECADIGGTYIAAGKTVSYALHEAIEGKIESVLDQLNTAKYMLSKYPDKENLKLKIDEMMLKLSGLKRIPTDMIDPISDISALMTKLALEETVQCQCGKSNMANESYMADDSIYRTYNGMQFKLNQSTDTFQDEDAAEKRKQELILQGKTVYVEHVRFGYLVWTKQ